MIQIVRQTFEEKYEMYMKCPKEELATMLANRDIYIENGFGLV
mgnify:CR=1 FL=1